MGAWGVSIGDLNEDGRSDILVSNFQEHESFEVPSYVYWNSRDGFDQTRRTSLFTQGAVGNTIADFDNDGHLDVCFNNTSNRWRGGVGPAFVYWGSADGQYSTARRLELPSVEPYDWAGGDLNDDGWPDLVIANMAEVGRRITENFIYWGGAEGFAAERRSALMGKGTRGVSVADLDRNGWLDVVCMRKQSASMPGKRTNVLLMNVNGVLTNQTSLYATASDAPGGDNDRAVGEPSARALARENESPPSAGVAWNRWPTTRSICPTTTSRCTSRAEPNPAP